MFPGADVTDDLLDFTMTRTNLVLTLARQGAVTVNIKTDVSLSPHVLARHREYSGHRASPVSWSMVCVMFVIPPA